MMGTNCKLPYCLFIQLVQIGSIKLLLLGRIDIVIKEIDYILDVDSESFLIDLTQNTVCKYIYHI